MNKSTFNLLKSEGDVAPEIHKFVPQSVVIVVQSSNRLKCTFKTRTVQINIYRARVRSRFKEERKRSGFKP